MDIVNQVANLITEDPNIINEASGISRPSGLEMPLENGRVPHTIKVMLENSKSGYYELKEIISNLISNGALKQDIQGWYHMSGVGGAEKPVQRIMNLVQSYQRLKSALTGGKGSFDPSPVITMRDNYLYIKPNELLQTMQGQLEFFNSVREYLGATGFGAGDPEAEEEGDSGFDLERMGTEEGYPPDKEDMPFLKN